MMWSGVSGRALVGCALCAFSAFAAGCQAELPANVVKAVPSRASRFVVTKFVADVAGTGAPVVDPLLVNPWGIAFDQAGFLWVANNGSGTATMYGANGAKQPLVVTIPSSTGATGGKPTGIAFNMTTGFPLPSGGIATFVFATENGTISAWNANAGTTATRVVDRSANGAVYKGIAIASTGGAAFVYATDFHNNAIDVFDRNFQFVRSFTDTTIAVGYAPFGIQNIGGLLYVTFGLRGPSGVDDEPGPGHGYVNIYNPDGSLIRHFTANGVLNSPWGVAQAPEGFGDLGGAILVGNFGDGTINAFNEGDGVFLGTLADPTNAPIVLPGLWGIAFGPLPTSATLYFASGPGNEAHGLVGTITPR